MLVTALNPYIGYENAKWTLLVKAFDALLLETRKGEFENSPVSYKDDRPQRPDDGAWTLTGYEHPVDFNVPYFVGLHGYNYKDEKEIKIDIENKQNSLDKQITSSMINNYVKADCIPNPELKKYNKEHIALNIQDHPYLHLLFLHYTISKTACNARLSAFIIP